MIATAACLLLFQTRPAPTPPAPTATATATAVPTSKWTKLERQLETLSKRFRGRLGVHVRMLHSDQRIGVRDAERYPSASTIKTAIALHAIREVDAGRRKWTDTYPLPPQNKRIEFDASIWSYYMRDNVPLNLDAYVNLTIVTSDNLTTRVLREWLGTVNINRSLTDLGLRDTLVLSSAPPSESRLRRLNGQFGMGMTTPSEMATLLELIYRGRAASPAGTERMIRILSHQYWDDWIGGSVPPGIVCASKSGAISRSRSDTAIVFAPRPYILTIYTDSQRDRRWVSENEGDLAIIRIAGLVWNATQDRPYSPPPGAKKFAPTGGVGE